MFERPCVQLKPGLRAATLARHRDIPELEDNNTDRHTVGVGVGVVHGALPQCTAWYAAWLVAIDPTRRCWDPGVGTLCRDLSLLAVHYFGPMGD